MVQYYLSERGQRTGPFSLDDLIERELDPDQYVWTEGFEDWRTAGAVAALAVALRPGSAVAHGVKPPRIVSQPYPAPAPSVSIADAQERRGPLARHQDAVLIATILLYVVGSVTSFVFFELMFRGGPTRGWGMVLGLANLGVWVAFALMPIALALLIRRPTARKIALVAAGIAAIISIVRNLSHFELPR